jgi:hypothetical protein
MPDVRNCRRLIREEVQSQLFALFSALIMQKNLKKTPFFSFDLQLCVDKLLMKVGG